MPASFLVYAGVNKLKDNFFGQAFYSFTTLELGTNFLLPMFELLLAVGLVLVPRRSIIILAVLTFSSFAGYLIRANWIGQLSCPCAGNHSSNVALILGLDFSCISLLLMHESLKETLQKFTAVLGIGLLIPFASYFWFANPHFADAITSSMKPSHLRAEYESPVEIMASSKYFARANISNRASKSIEIAEFMPSCACTTISPNSLVLAPGQTRSISLTVDLNKAFQRPDQSQARLEVFVACQDRQRVEFANLQVLGTFVNRTFAPVRNKILHLCTDDSSECEIPIIWFDEHAKLNISVFIEGQPVTSTLSDAGVTIPLPHVQQPFTSVVYELRHISSRGLCCAEVQVSYVSNPHPVSMEMLTSAMTSENTLGKAIWYDITGEQSMTESLVRDDNYGNPYDDLITFDDHGAQHNAGYAQMEWTNEEGFRQTFHIPVFSEDKHE